MEITEDIPFWNQIGIENQKKKKEDFYDLWFRDHQHYYNVS